MKQNSQETDGAAAVAISGTPPAGGYTRIAQSFQTATAAATLAVGYLGLYGKKVGNGCDLTIQLWTNSGGVPSAQQGTVEATLPADFWATSNGWVYVPLPVSGLSASTTYWVVLISGDVNGNNAGDASNYVDLEKSNQTSGAATYASSAWTAGSYGLMFREYDQTVSGSLTIVWEDAGARWTWLNWSGAVLAGVDEYTVAQAAGQLRSVRTITDSGLVPQTVT